MLAKTENITVYAQYEHLPADYSEINEVLFKIQVDLSICTEESVSALNKAVWQIKQGYTSDKQVDVDYVIENGYMVGTGNCAFKPESKNT